MAHSHVFSVALSRPFIAECAAELIAKHGAQLHQAVLFLPNQRTARMLREALAAQQPAHAVLLPLLIPAQRVTRENLLNVFSHAPEAIADILAIPPAMDDDTRLALIARQVQASHRLLAQFQHVPKALEIARELAKLHDDFILHHASLDLLQRAGQHSIHHYGDVLKRLFAVIVEHWPTLCQAHGAISAAEHQQQLQSAFIRHLPGLGEGRPVYVIGSTGSVKSTRQLMQAVAAHPHGAVIIPGATGTPPMPHARLHVNHTLEALGVGADGASIIGTQSTATASATMLTAATSEEEARMVALLIREHLHTREGHCLVITPDVGLMKRIAAQLACLGIRANTPPLQLLCYRDDVQPWLAMTHVASLPESQYVQRALLDVCAPRNAADNEAWQHCIQLLDHTRYRRSDSRTSARMNDAPPRVRALADDFSAWVKRLHSLRSGRYSADAWLAHLQAAAQACAHVQVPDLPEAMANRMASYDALGPMSMNDFSHLLNELANQPVSAPQDYDVRISMLTPIEARLHHGEHVIFTNFHSAYWPHITGQNAWLGTHLRQEAGLPTADDEMALAAHDIWLHASSATRISCTRALNDSGRITHASPLADMLPLHDHSEPYRSWAQAQWQPEALTPEAPTAPNPAITARPRTLRVSDLDTLFADPYSIYARYILQLEPLDDYDTPAEGRELGTLAHALIQQIVSRALDDAAAHTAWIEKRVDSYGLPRSEALFWKRRLACIADFAVSLRDELEAAGISVQLEEPLSDSYMLAEHPITLEGRADMITTDGQGIATVVDFKTGKAPTKTSIMNGQSAQLLGYALLLELRGVSALNWRYSELPKVNTPVSHVDAQFTPDALAERKALFNAQLETLLFQQTPFLAHPLIEEGVDSKRDAYDGVSRIEEWG